MVEPNNHMFESSVHVLHLIVQLQINKM